MPPTEDAVVGFFIPPEANEGYIDELLFFKDPVYDAIRPHPEFPEALQAASQWAPKITRPFR
jgi:hypothetical protein